MDSTQANDQRQIYLTAGGGYFYPTDVQLHSDGDVTITLPADLPAGGYDITVCSYGRLCTEGTSGAITVVSPEHELAHPAGYADMPGYGQLYDINDSGAIIGVLNDDNGNARAAYWPSQDAQATLLPVVSNSQPYTSASAINAGGLIAGWAYDDTNGQVLTLWDPSNGYQATDLLFVGDLVNGLNDNGDILGYGQDATLGQGQWHYTVWLRDSGGAYTAAPLIPPPAPSNLFAPLAFNNARQVAGYAGTSGGALWAVVWPDYTAAPVNLNTTSDTVSSQANKISEDSVIVGTIYKTMSTTACGDIQVQVPVAWMETAPGSNVWGDPIELPLPPGVASATPVDINTADQILGQTVGICPDYEGPDPIFWTYSGGGVWVAHTFQTLTKQNQRSVSAVNSSEQVVGWDTRDSTNADVLAVWDLTF
jgi:hypothetical protein